MTPETTPGSRLARVVAWLRLFWRRLRAWRRIYFTRGGLLFTAGAFGVGFAAMNTGNNLLFLILGAMLGAIVLSSWLSEQSIRELRIRRHPPRPGSVGERIRIVYEVENPKRWIPSFAIELREAGLPGAAYFSRLDGGESVTVRSRHRFVRRGVYPLNDLTISTSYPFGLFRKERDVEIPGELVVWPRIDREVRPVAAEGKQGARTGAAQRGRPGSRGEYRGLRSYRAGDDPRDIHWRSTARLGEPVLREYEEDGAEALWLCLDTRGEPGNRAEVAVELAAALAARFGRAGRRFGLATPDGRLIPDRGPGQLEGALDALARIEFEPDSPLVSPPVEPRRCILVSLAQRRGAAFGDVVVPGPEATLAAVPQDGPEEWTGGRGPAGRREAEPALEVRA